MKYHNQVYVKCVTGIRAGWQAEETGTCFARKPEEAKGWPRPLGVEDKANSPPGRGQWARNTQGSTGFRQGQAPVAASSVVGLGRLPRGEAFRSSLDEDRNRLANRLRAGASGESPAELATLQREPRFSSSCCVFRSSVFSQDPRMWPWVRVRSSAKRWRVGAHRHANAGCGDRFWLQAVRGSCPGPGGPAPPERGRRDPEAACGNQEPWEAGSAQLPRPQNHTL